MFKHFATASSLFGLLALLFLTLPINAGERNKEPGAAGQRAMCDAKCREDYQGNAPALSACLRDCGAIEPASAGVPTVGPGVTEQTTTVKGSKSNSDNRQIAPVVPPPEPAQATNLNSSRSNASERQIAPVVPPPEPAEASNLNLSKSNVDRKTGQGEETNPCTSESQTDCD